MYVDMYTTYFTDEWASVAARQQSQALQQVRTLVASLNSMVFSTPAGTLVIFLNFMGFTGGELHLNHPI